MFLPMRSVPGTFTGCPPIATAKKCPIICCNGKRSKPPSKPAPGSMICGARRISMTNRTGCGAFISSNRASAALKSTHPAPGICRCTKPVINSSSAHCRNSFPVLKEKVTESDRSRPSSPLPFNRLSSKSACRTAQTPRDIITNMNLLGKINLNLDISAGVGTAFLLALGGAVLSFILGVRLIRKGSRLVYFKKRQAMVSRGWRFILISILLLIAAYLLNNFAKPAIYSIFPPSPTITNTSTITLSPTISETPLSNADTHRNAIHHNTPMLPDFMHKPPV